MLQATGPVKKRPVAAETSSDTSVTSPHSAARAASKVSPVRIAVLITAGVPTRATASHSSSRLAARANGAVGNPPSARKVFSRARCCAVCSATPEGRTGASASIASTAAMGTLLAIHLGVVAAFFIMIPYGKLAHVVYRYSALVKNAVESVVDEMALTMMRTVLPIMIISTTVSST